MNKEEFYRLIESRKSIRKYKPDLPPKEMIERVLIAAMHAPSGKNRQNWRFFVVTGAKKDEYLKLSQKAWLGIKDLLQVRLKPSLYQFTERFFFTLGEAPVIIFCYSHNNNEERYHTSIGSVYMAVENLCLAALVEGLGTCTMGAPLEIKSEVDQFLNLSKNPEFQAGELELPRQTESRIEWIN
jgi:nitroreductase